MWALYGMSTIGFIETYFLISLVIVLAIWAIRFKHLLPLINSEEMEANVTFVDAKGTWVTVNNTKIQVPISTASPLEVGQKIKVWGNSKYPMHLFTEKPVKFDIAVKSIKPAFIVLFALSVPLFFIIKGNQAI